MKIGSLRGKLLLSCLVAVAAFGQQRTTNPDVSTKGLHEAFAHPPDDSRIMVRWWWFGPSATREELTRELEQMKSSGIGGVEIATLYPLALDDPKTGFHNYSFVSDEHIENLRFVAEEARRLGLRVDVTLGSGWPFGGAHIPVTEGAGELRVESDPVAGGESSIAVPSLESGEKLIVAFVSQATAAQGDLRDAKAVPIGSGPRLELPERLASARVATFF